MGKYLPRHTITLDEFESLQMGESDFTEEAIALLSANCISDREKFVLHNRQQEHLWKPIRKSCQWYVGLARE
jgi:hypothetical protein